MENGLLYILAFSAMTIALFACVLPQASNLDLPSFATYTIKTDGTNYRAVKHDGTVSATSTNASYIFNTYANGNPVYVLDGNYTFTTKILITQKHTIISAGSNVYFIGSILPIFEIDGDGMDGTEAEILNDIQLSNIKFVYTGSVANGQFVYIHELQNDNKYQGAILFSNIVVRSNQTSIPTNVDFIGLRIEDAIGIDWTYISVAYFGTGIKLTKTSWQGSHNYYLNTMVGYCKYGIYYTGGYTCETWQSMKIMHCTSVGMLSDYNTPNELILLSPQLESFSGAWAGIDVQPLQFICINGMFSTLNYGSSCVALKVHGDTVRSAHSSIIKNNFFYQVATAIKVGTANTELGGNIYDATVTNKVALAGTGAGITVSGDDIGFVNRNSFSGANTTATTAVLNHGCAGTLDYAWVSFSDGAITGYTWSSTSTQITVTPTGTLPASWTVYVKGEYVP